MWARSMRDEMAAKEMVAHSLSGSSIAYTVKSKLKNVPIKKENKDDRQTSGKTEDPTEADNSLHGMGELSRDTGHRSFTVGSEGVYNRKTGDIINPIGKGDIAPEIDG